MALLMIARISPRSPEGDEARQRALGIAHALADNTLLARAAASARDRG